MRGRRPSGPNYVEQLPGSELARERAKVVLETLAGGCRVLEACRRLDISEPRFQQLRTQLVAAAVASMEPGRAGRPAHTLSPEQEEIAALKRQLADLEVELRAARAREEIALVLPKVVHDPVTHDNDPEKKTRRRRRRSRNRPPGMRKNT